MEEVIGDIQRWRAQGEQVALATVVQTWGSAPRRPGAKMAITANGRSPDDASASAALIAAGSCPSMVTARHPNASALAASDSADCCRDT